MTWGWLTAILDSLLKHAQRQAEKPKTTHDAKTPPDVADHLRKSHDDWLRNQKRDSGGHGEGLGSDKPPGEG